MRYKDSIAHSDSQSFSANRKWTEWFDPATSPDAKKECRDLLMSGFVGGELQNLKQNRFTEIGETKLTKKSIIVLMMSGVMAGSRTLVDEFYHYLKSKGVAGPVVMMGYSSNKLRLTEPKRFSDGTPMLEKVYIPQEHLEIVLDAVKGNDYPSLLIVDDRLNSGNSMAVVLDAIRRIGYMGEIYLTVMDRWVQKPHGTFLRIFTEMKFKDTHPSLFNPESESQIRNKQIINEWGEDALKSALRE